MTASPSTEAGNVPPDTAIQRAKALHMAGQVHEAEEIYRSILCQQPDHFDAHHLSGIAAFQTGRMELALEHWHRALAIDPGAAKVHTNLATLLKQLDRKPDAITHYRQAVALDPGFASGWYNLGVLLLEDAQPDAAIPALEQAVRLDPRDADALNNLGTALRAAGRPDAAIARYDAAIALRPDFAEAWSNRGLALHDLERFTEALASHDRAAALNPGRAGTHVNRGTTLLALRRLDAALAAFDTAWSINPDAPCLDGTRLQLKLQMCDWRGIAADKGRIEARITAGAVPATPFTGIAVLDKRTLQRMLVENWQRQQGLPAFVPPPSASAGGPRLRIGYFSSDLHNHATAHLIAGVIEAHDRSRFDIHAFAFGPRRDDAMRRRLHRAFEHFHVVDHLSDSGIAALAREQGIDIAIDLKGITQDSRPGIFAHGAAPVQVNFLGFPGTIPSGCLQYLIADQTLIPPDHCADYAEKIVHLPHSYQPNDRRRDIASTAWTRQDAGLPAQGFVFCAFNNSYKITPEVFAAWMRILQHTPGSVLWLLEDNAWAAANLRREAAARGIDAARLVFAPRLPLAEHLARHRLADLFLDTLPCCAHTTASDALWAGTPVLTQLGETFAGRVAASLLRAIGLPELIAPDQAAYEAMAISLASDADRLAALQARLSANRLTQPLFDTAGFTRDLERGFVAMHQRCQAGLPPDHIVLPA